MKTQFGKYGMATLVALTTFLASSAAHAQTATDNAASARWYALAAAAVGLGIAAFGGGLGQGRAAAAALDGIARNPGASDKLFTPMILGLALIESLVIYALLIAFLVYGKVG